MLEPDWRTATVFGSFVRSYLSSAAPSHSTCRAAAREIQDSSMTGQIGDDLVP
jgi:hypothetical protein